MKRKANLLALLLALLLCLCCCAGEQSEGDVIHLEEVTEAAQETEVPADSAGETETPTEEAAPAEESAPPAAPEAEQDEALPESGSYTSKTDVARYIYLYGHLPGNFITKKEAKALGWVSSQGNLGEVAPGKSIGGDYFGNYEGLLPTAEGREYRECDIDTDGSYRGGKRIVFSNDGLIYYTEDHYNTFTLLYGEE